MQSLRLFSRQCNNTLNCTTVKFLHGRFCIVNWLMLGTRCVVLTVVVPICFFTGTYKKNNCGFPLYQIMVQDNTGRGRAVFYCFIQTETNISLKHLLEVCYVWVHSAHDCQSTACLTIHKPPFIRD